MTCKSNIEMTSPPEVYLRRRAKLASQLSRPLLVCAGTAAPRNYASNVHPFRAGSTYLYLGGPALEGAAWIIEPNSDGDLGSVLLRPAVTPDDVVWDGAPPCDGDIAAAAGISMPQLGDPTRLPKLLGDRVGGVIATPCLRTHAWISAAGLEPAHPEELLAVIAQRLIKDEHEMAAMRRAADVTVDAHLAAMAACIPGRLEVIAAAAFEEVIARNQCKPSFTPIVTMHGEVLHLHGYGNCIESGSLLLVDGGAEEPGCYACDVTRTYPTSGEWSAVQRHLYETVLIAQKEAVAACVPGARFRDIHDLSARMICKGLVAAELLKGDAAELAERKAHTLFYPHGLGHLIGLDVHDMEDFGDLAGYAPGRERREHFGDNFLRLDRDLEPGMTVTIEPGLYLVPAIWDRDDLIGPFADVVNRSNIDALLKENFGGIRIEETIAIQASGGPEELSAALPNQADEVAKLVGGSSAR